MEEKIVTKTGYGSEYRHEDWVWGRMSQIRLGTVVNIVIYSGYGWMTSLILIT